MCDMFSQAGCKEVLHPREVLRHWKRHCLIYFFFFLSDLTAGLICGDYVIRKPVNLGREGRGYSKIFL